MSTPITIDGVARPLPRDGLLPLGLSRGTRLSRPSRSTLCSDSWLPPSSLPSLLGLAYLFSALSPCLLAMTGNLDCPLVEFHCFVVQIS